ncbi:MFS transporter [Catellatospora sp. KI3]|uniref:CynX/NimT family MFS transporter n=1 Tax=Catellatospora sp. KI3 TaxID=3041620 RepID=UPI0024831B27|nr:MFS transporter [Catellatospora sp. KI3]MDI1464489.1 MFS transporter [Catellatospora sp. KI3]
MIAPRAARVTIVPSRGRTALVAGAGILLVALNLRAAITSLGALLEEVSAGLHLSATAAGAVTTLPALVFAAFGALTPRLARRLSAAQLLVGSMLLLAAGQLIRVVTDSATVFLLSSALALAGIAVANILLPALVKEHFPDRAGLVTGVYTMTLILGSTLAAAVSVPIAHALGGWRAGMGVWGLLALAAALPWLATRRGAAARAAGAEDGEPLRPGRTRLGWAMAVYFGAQSLSGYATMGWLAQMFRDAGFSPATAGLLLAAVPAFGVPVALLMPAIAGRLTNLRGLVLLMSTAMIASYVGLALAPHSGALAWVVLLAFGQSAFPLALAMIGMRARTQRGVVALSAFAQSTGYLIAALGPLVVGVLYELTGGWTLPLGFLLAAAVVQAVAGIAAARPRHLEDEACNRAHIWHELAPRRGSVHP